MGVNSASANRGVWASDPSGDPGALLQVASGIIDGTPEEAVDTTYHGRPDWLYYITSTALYLLDRTTGDTTLVWPAASGGGAGGWEYVFTATDSSSEGWAGLAWDDTNLIVSLSNGELNFYDTAGNRGDSEYPPSVESPTGLSNPSNTSTDLWETYTDYVSNPAQPYAASYDVVSGRGVSETYLTSTVPVTLPADSFLRGVEWGYVGVPVSGYVETLWVTAFSALYEPPWSSGLGTLRRINPVDGTEIVSFSTPGVFPSEPGQDAAGGFLWVADRDTIGGPTEYLYRISLDDGSVVDTLQAPDVDVQSLAFDGQYLWALDHSTGKVYRYQLVFGF